MYPQGGGTDITYFFYLFIHSYTCILITVPLYRRKFCDGHIILVYKWTWDSNKWSSKWALRTDLEAQKGLSE